MLAYDLLNGNWSDAAADADSDECTSVHAAALVCSGFERADFEAEWPDPSVSTTASLERTTQRAHSGSASLHATSAAADSLAVVDGRGAQHIVQLREPIALPPTPDAPPVG